MTEASLEALPRTVRERPAPNLLRRTLELLAPDWPLALVTILLLIAATLAGLAGPWILRYAIDHGLKGAPPDVRILRNSSVAFLTLATASFLLARTHERLSGKLGERFVRELRRKAFAHLMAMPTGFFDRSPSGRLIARLTSDVDTLQDVVQLGLSQFVHSVLTLIVLVGILVSLSPLLALLSLAPLLLLFFGARSFQRDSRRAYALLRERVGVTMTNLIESMAGAKVVQAFAREEARIQRFHAENARQLAASLAAIRVHSRFLPVIELSTLLSTVVALGAGGYLVQRGEVSIGTVSAFALYLLLAFDPVQSLSFLLNNLQSAAAGLEKIFVLLDEPVELAEGSQELPARARLTLEGVSFAYGEHAPKVLEHVSLSLAHGERLALVGPTGAGKSTLAKLMARICDPSTGEVRYGTVDLRQASFSALRRRIVMVTQEGHVFQGSVADNLRAVKPDASDAELEAALERIGALERFRALPEGLASDVGVRGALLSSGERQLLALARVALLDADVLIFDEATSSLDPGTERAVNRALETLMDGRSVVLIAHRLSTMQQVDHIAVIADGGIAEYGSHPELLARGGRYSALYQEWLASHASQ